MRKRIYAVLEGNTEDRLGSAYSTFMLICILLSIVPLCFKSDNAVFHWIDKATVSVFIADYLLRWYTADYTQKPPSKSVFVRYPFTFFAIIDLLSILPSLSLLSSGFKLGKLLRLGRLLKTMRAARSFKTLRLLRYSRNFEIILSVIKKEGQSLLAVGGLAVGYVFFSALIMFQVEPDSFDTLWDALYWACVTLTTVGYGDIYPVTTLGRILGAIIAFSGIAALAIPTGIITAGLTERIARNTETARELKRQHQKDIEHDNELARQRGRDDDHDRILREHGEMLKTIVEKLEKLSEANSEKRSEK